MKWVIRILFSFSLSAGKKPNIVFVLADDPGWSELRHYESDFNETPHLDCMAEEGMRFTNISGLFPHS